MLRFPDSVFSIQSRLATGMIGLGLICSGNLAIAQPDSVTLVNMFDTPEDIHWIKTYQGLMSGTTPFTLCLGRDDDEFIGLWSVAPYDQSFELIGEPLTDMIRLAEINPDGLVCGWIEWTTSSSGMSGFWTDFKGQGKIELEAFLTDPIPQSSPAFKLFAGSIEDEKYRLIIGSSPPSARMYKTGADHFVPLLAPDCLDTDCNKRHYMVDSYGESNYGQMTVQLEPRRVEVKLPGKESEELFLKSEYSTRTTYHQNYSSLFDFVYPSISKPRFRQLIQDRIQSWNERLSTFDKDLREQLGGEPADLRWKFRSYAWIDMIELDKNFISFLMIYRDPDGTYDTESFIYEIKEDIFHDRESMLRKEDDLLQIVEDLRSEEILYLQRREENQTAEWVSQVEFKHLSLARHGFWISSDFDIDRGVYSLFISPERVDDLLRKKSFAQHILTE